MSGDLEITTQVSLAGKSIESASMVANGPGWTFWAILLSASIALLSIAAQRAVAKRRAAIDLILRSESADFIKCKAMFDDLVQNGVLKNVIEPKGGEDYDRKKHVRELLNHYELLAISIANNIVDEQIIKQYQRGTIVRTWDQAEALIKEIQMVPGNERVFCHFEDLTKRWKARPDIETGVWPTARKVLKEIFPV